MTRDMVTNGDIIKYITGYAPPCLQEEYDNTGVQIGSLDDVCTGVMLCVDVTPEVIAEAVTEECNLVISHHPVLFRGVKSLTGATLVERVVIDAIRAGLTVYSCHTALDNAPGGVSARMARMLGLHHCRVLDRVTDSRQCAVPEGREAGCGMTGLLAAPLTPALLVEKVKSVFGSPVARCTRYPSEALIERVALCGGSGAFLIDKAIASGAQAFITSDVKYHDFVDYASRILIIDIGHYESEYCATEIFMDIIREKFPNFAVRVCRNAANPIIYM